MAHGSGIGGGGCARWGLVLVLVLGLSGAVTAGPPCPCPDEIRLTQGDEYVILEWDDPPADQIYSTELEVGSWSGRSVPVAAGFDGRCDNTVELRTALVGNAIQIVWSDLQGTSDQFDLLSPGSVFALSDGITVQFPGTAELGPLDHWGGASPRLDGFFVNADSAVYSLQAQTGGTVGASQSETTPDLRLVWVDSVSGASGVLGIPRADSLLSFDRGLKIAFSPGSVYVDSTFSIRAWRAVVHDQVVKIHGFAFAGYKIWRADVLDLNEPRLLRRISLCDPADSVFFRCDSRIYVDGVEPWYQGFVNGECTGNVARDMHGRIALTGDVTNGFPYYYGVTTYDVQGDSVVVDPDVTLGQGTYWRKVYPSEAPRTNVSEVRVIPNPYTVREAWEEGEAKITFDNLPARATIYVYDVIGQMVIRLEHSSATEDFKSWNLKSATGRDIVSGTYIFKVESPDGEKIGKFIVIR